MIQKLYDILIPKSFRLIFIELINRIKSLPLKRTILHYYSHKKYNYIDSIILEALEYIKHYGIHSFPYTWQKKYKYRKVKVLNDKSVGLFYTFLDGKPLYFKKSLKIWDVKRRFNFLSIEQDNFSPHKYLTSDFDVNSDDIIADIGAAEGNFSLSIVEKVKKIYLFEAEDGWIEALYKTFEPWKDKVEIVNAFVSDKIGEKIITLNDFFRNKQDKPTFLKIDVEGAEKSVLDGASEILNNSNLKVALCTYHNENDFDLLSEFMWQNHFKIIPSDGYLLVTQEPYFRKVLIRCTKVVN